MATEIGSPEARLEHRPPRLSPDDFLKQMTRPQRREFNRRRADINASIKTWAGALSAPGHEQESEIIRAKVVDALHRLKRFESVPPDMVRQLVIFDTLKNYLTLSPQEQERSPFNAVMTNLSKIDTDQLLLYQAITLNEHEAIKAYNKKADKHNARLAEKYKARLDEYRQRPPPSDDGREPDPRRRENVRAVQQSMTARKHLEDFTENGERFGRVKIMTKKSEGRSARMENEYRSDYQIYATLKRSLMSDDMLVFMKALATEGVNITPEKIDSLGPTLGLTPEEIAALKQNPTAVALSHLFDEKMYRVMGVTYREALKSDADKKLYDRLHGEVGPKGKTSPGLLSEIVSHTDAGGRDDGYEGYATDEKKMVIQKNAPDFSALFDALQIPENNRQAIVDSIRLDDKTRVVSTKLRLGVVKAQAVDPQSRLSGGHERNVVRRFEPGQLLLRAFKILDNVRYRARYQAPTPPPQPPPPNQPFFWDHVDLPLKIPSALRLTQPLSPPVSPPPTETRASQTTVSKQVSTGHPVPSDPYRRLQKLGAELERRANLPTPTGPVINLPAAPEYPFGPDKNFPENIFGQNVPQTLPSAGLPTVIPGQLAQTILAEPPPTDTTPVSPAAAPIPVAEPLGNVLPTTEAQEVVDSQPAQTVAAAEAQITEIEGSGPIKLSSYAGELFRIPEVAEQVQIRVQEGTPVLEYTGAGQCVLTLKSQGNNIVYLTNQDGTPENSYQLKIGDIFTIGIANGVRYQGRGPLATLTVQDITPNHIDLKPGKKGAKEHIRIPLGQTQTTATPAPQPVAIDEAVRPAQATPDFNIPPPESTETIPDLNISPDEPTEDHTATEQPADAAATIATATAAASPTAPQDLTEAAAVAAASEEVATNQIDVTKSQEVTKAIDQYPKFRETIIKLAQLYCDPRLHNCEIVGNSIFYTDPSTKIRRELKPLSRSDWMPGAGSHRVVFEGPTPDTVIKLHVRGSGSQSAEELSKYAEMNGEDKNNVVGVYGFRKMIFNGHENIVLLEDRVNIVSEGKNPIIGEVTSTIRDAELFPNSSLASDDYIKEHFGLNNLAELKLAQALFKWGKSRLEDAGFANIGRTADGRLVFHDFGTLRSGSRPEGDFLLTAINFDAVKNEVASAGQAVATLVVESPAAEPPITATVPKPKTIEQRLAELFGRPAEQETAPVTTPTAEPPATATTADDHQGPADESVVTAGSIREETNVQAAQAGLAVQPPATAEAAAATPAPQPAAIDEAVRPAQAVSDLSVPRDEPTKTIAPVTEQPADAAATAPTPTTTATPTAPQDLTEAAAAAPVPEQKTSNQILAELLDPVTSARAIEMFNKNLKDLLDGANNAVAEVTISTLTQLLQMDPHDRQETVIKVLNELTDTIKPKGLKEVMERCTDSQRSKLLQAVTTFISSPAKAVPFNDTDPQPKAFNEALRRWSGLLFDSITPKDSASSALMEQVISTPTFIQAIGSILAEPIINDTSFSKKYDVIWWLKNVGEKKSYNDTLRPLLSRQDVQDGLNNIINNAVENRKRLVTNETFYTFTIDDAKELLELANQLGPLPTSSVASPQSTAAEPAAATTPDDHQGPADESVVTAGPVREEKNVQAAQASQPPVTAGAEATVSTGTNIPKGTEIKVTGTDKKNFLTVEGIVDINDSSTVTIVDNNRGSSIVASGNSRLFVVNNYEPVAAFLNAIVYTHKNLAFEISAYSNSSFHVANQEDGKAVLLDDNSSLFLEHQPSNLTVYLGPTRDNASENERVGALLFLPKSYGQKNIRFSEYSEGYIKFIKDTSALCTLTSNLPGMAELDLVSNDSMSRGGYYVHREGNEQYVVIKAKNDKEEDAFAVFQVMRVPVAKGREEEKLVFIDGRKADDLTELTNRLKIKTRNPNLDLSKAFAELSRPAATAAAAATPTAEETTRLTTPAAEPQTINKAAAITDSPKQPAASQPAAPLPAQSTDLTEAAAAIVEAPQQVAAARMLADLLDVSVLAFTRSDKALNTISNNLNARFTDRKDLMAEPPLLAFIELLKLDPRVMFSDKTDPETQKRYAYVLHYITSKLDLRLLLRVSPAESFLHLLAKNPDFFTAVAAFISYPTQPILDDEDRRPLNFNSAKSTLTDFTFSCLNPKNDASGRIIGQILAAPQLTAAIGTILTEPFINKFTFWGKRQVISSLRALQDTENYQDKLQNILNQPDIKKALNELKNNFETNRSIDTNSEFVEQRLVYNDAVKLLKLVKPLDQPERPTIAETTPVIPQRAAPLETPQATAETTEAAAALPANQEQLAALKRQYEQQCAELEKLFRVYNNRRKIFNVTAGRFSVADYEAILSARQAQLEDKPALNNASEALREQRQLLSNKLSKLPNATKNLVLLGALDGRLIYHELANNRSLLVNDLRLNAIAQIDRDWFKNAQLTKQNPALTELREYLIRFFSVVALGRRIDSQYGQGLLNKSLIQIFTELGGDLSSTDDAYTAYESRRSEYDRAVAAVKRLNPTFTPPDFSESTPTRENPTVLNQLRNMARGLFSKK